MSFNYNPQNNNYNNQNNHNGGFVPIHVPLPKQDEAMMTGQKVLSADRDELNDKMSDIRLQSYHNQSNRYYQPFRPELINIESTLNRNHAGKKTEFKDTINNRMSNCHNSQLLQSQPSQLFQQPIQQNQANNITYQDDRFLSNSHQTNKFTNRDRNNARLCDLTPLSNNVNLGNNNIHHNQMGISSNNLLDENGNLKHVHPSQRQQYQNNNMNNINNNNNNHFVHNCQQKPNYITEEQYKFINQNQNLMTVGRLPESNQSSRVNFKDRANQRLQNLVSLPRTSSLPIVPIQQTRPNSLWQNDRKNSQNMKNRINEINPNCQVVVNEMMPINTQLMDYD